MSVINKIPRGLRVLITLAVLAVLVWKFATDNYFYPAIGAAILVTALVVFLTYRSPGNLSKKTGSKKKKSQSDNIENDDKLIPDENLEFDDVNTESETSDESFIGPAARKIPAAGVLKGDVKPRAADVAANYIRMSKTAEVNPVSGDWQPSSRSQISQPEPEQAKPVSEELSPVDGELKQEIDPSDPPIPIIEDETSLSTEDQNQLVNAVWCRCENPFCKYTRFLGVHHILDEKEGGTNKLDNLIVLCPYCHDLAHKNEIPEAEMRSWIVKREERFKFKPELYH
jgi:hypothetical protein